MKHLIRSLPLVILAFTVPLASAQDETGQNDPDRGGCIDEGRSRTHMLGDRAGPVYPFAVGPRSLE